MEGETSADFTLRCPVCKASLNLASVQGHKKHHHAMRIMRFKQGSSPKNLESLSKRHKALIRKVLDKYMDCPDDLNLMKRIEKINDAYELLRHEFTQDDADLKALLSKDGKTSMRDGYFEERDKVLQDEIETESIGTYKQLGYPSCVYGIGKSQAMNREWRDRMEDCVSIEGNINISSLKCACYLGMFDGYHGDAAATKCSEKLGSLIFDEIAGFENDLSENAGIHQTTFSCTSVNSEDSHELHLSDTEVSRCVIKAYAQMDKYLGYGIGEKSRVRWSGCSALTCLIAEEDFRATTVISKGENTYQEPRGPSTHSESDGVLQNCEKIGKAYISSAGDVQAVLYQNRKPLLLNHSHTLDNAEERKRVTKAGAFINSNDAQMKIQGLITTTRGLGNHGDLKLKKCTIPIPQTCVAHLTKESQFLVVATQSLWEVLSPNDVFNVLFHFIPPDAMTVLKSGPIPIVPVVHGHIGAGSKGNGDGQRLPSIVETEEDDAIEEVIFVHAEHSDSEDEEEITGCSGLGDGDHSDSSRTVAANRDRQKIEREDFDSHTSTYSDSSHKVPADVEHDKMILMRRQYARIASTLSAQLVHAAINAGAVENISVVVVLCGGLFS